MQEGKERYKTHPHACQKEIIQLSTLHFPATFLKIPISPFLTLFSCRVSNTLIYDYNIYLQENLLLYCKADKWNDLTLYWSVLVSDSKF